MKQIGIISDTHSYLDDKVFKHFSVCDEIWHAGDIGLIEVAQKLEDFKPFRAVFGNIDGLDVRALYKENELFDCEGLKIYMTHIAGVPEKYNKPVQSIIQSERPNLFVCGHSHNLRISTDKAHHNMLFLNPGAAGIHGFHQIRTIVRLKIEDARIFDVQVIELGKRSQIIK